MQISDLNSKPHGGKSLRDIIYRAIGVCLYPPPVSYYYKLLCIYRFRGSTRTNGKHINNNEEKIT